MDRVIHGGKLVLLGILFVLIVAFAISNRQSVPIQLNPLPWQFELPLFLFGLLMLTFGFIWGGSLNLSRRWQSSRSTRREREKVEALNAELAVLRAQQTVPAATGKAVVPPASHV